MLSTSVPIYTNMNTNNVSMSLISHTVVNYLPQECGRVVPKGVTYIIGGKEVEAGEFPWHVGLYFNPNKTQICGGSLISRNLVLTAAHCFKLSNNTESYTVIAGKYHRDWNTVDGGEQRLSVRSIEVKERYTGSQNRYENDIAILVLNVEVNITDVVSIVCLDSNKGQAKFHLEEPSIGKVAGWGINDNDTESEKLLTANLPFVGYNECRKSFSETFRPFITNDKFCAGYLNGTSVCQGDSGGGLVFGSPEGTKTSWYLQGVVSLGETSRDLKCSKQRTLFTKVVDHMEWILDILVKYEP